MPVPYGVPFLSSLLYGQALSFIPSLTPFPIATGDIEFPCDSWDRTAWVSWYPATRVSKFGVLTRILNKV